MHKRERTHTHTHTHTHSTVPHLRMNPVSFHTRKRFDSSSGVEAGWNAGCTNCDTAPRLRCWPVESSTIKLSPCRTHSKKKHRGVAKQPSSAHAEREETDRDTETHHTRSRTGKDRQPQCTTADIVVVEVVSSVLIIALIVIVAVNHCMGSRRALHFDLPPRLVVKQLLNICRRARNARRVSELSAGCWCTMLLLDRQRHRNTHTSHHITSHYTSPPPPPGGFRAPTCTGCCLFLVLLHLLHLLCRELLLGALPDRLRPHREVAKQICKRTQ